jgi:hypothetical protein
MQKLHQEIPAENAASTLAQPHRIRAPNRIEHLNRRLLPIVQARSQTEHAQRMALHNHKRKTP